MGRARLACRRIFVGDYGVRGCRYWPYAQVANLRHDPGLVGIRHLLS